MGKEIHPQESHEIRKRPSESGINLEVSKQKHRNQCCPNLGLHGIRARTHKGLNFEVLFQILKADLDPLAVFINGGDGGSSAIHVVGGEYTNLFGLRIIAFDSPERIGAPLSRSIPCKLESSSFRMFRF